MVDYANSIVKACTALEAPFRQSCEILGTLYAVLDRQKKPLEVHHQGKPAPACSTFSECLQKLPALVADPKKGGRGPFAPEAIAYYDKNRAVCEPMTGPYLQTWKNGKPLSIKEREQCMITAGLLVFQEFPERPTKPASPPPKKPEETVEVSPRKKDECRNVDCYSLTLLDVGFHLEEGKNHEQEIVGLIAVDGARRRIRFEIRYDAVEKGNDLIVTYRIGKITDKITIRRSSGWEDDYGFQIVPDGDDTKSPKAIILTKLP
ncbi:MAG: hypothetical protein HY540_02485 [Deltaproteobacteria bacterium]|nr:hypothetical protein [Deltaproteobacteria bacterium]